VEGTINVYTEPSTFSPLVYLPKRNAGRPEELLTVGGIKP
jgi:hypothetical protein